jgi:hypothetical protein
LPTVGFEQPNSAATAVLVAPAALASTIRARSANDCAEDGRRAHRCS